MGWVLVVVITFSSGGGAAHRSMSPMPSLEVCLRVVEAMKIGTQVPEGDRNRSAGFAAYCTKIE